MCIRILYLYIRMYCTVLYIHTQGIVGDSLYHSLLWLWCPELVFLCA